MIDLKNIPEVLNEMTILFGNNLFFNNTEMFISMMDIKTFQHGRF